MTVVQNDPDAFATFIHECLPIGFQPILPLGAGIDTTARNLIQIPSAARRTGG
jgi:hypothetical protein